MDNGQIDKIVEEIKDKSRIWTVEIYDTFEEKEIENWDFDSKEEAFEYVKRYKEENDENEDYEYSTEMQYKFNETGIREILRKYLMEK